MFLLAGVKQKVAMPLIPFLLSLAVLGSSIVLALYGCAIMLELEEYTSFRFTGFRLFDGYQFIEGGSFFLIGLIMYVAWLEIGLDFVLKRFK